MFSSWWHIFLQKQQKFWVTFWANVKNNTLKVKTTMTTFRQHLKWIWLLFMSTSGHTAVTSMISKAFTTSKTKKWYFLSKIIPLLTHRYKLLEHKTLLKIWPDLQHQEDQCWVSETSFLQPVWQCHCDAPSPKSLEKIMN